MRTQNTTRLALAAALKSDIPDNVVSEFVWRRQRNFNVSKAALASFFPSGSTSRVYMCVTLDDSSPFGFNIAESLQIKSIVASRATAASEYPFRRRRSWARHAVPRSLVTPHGASVRLALIWRLPQEQAQARAQLRRSGAERVGRFSLHADLEHRLENEPVH